MKKYIRACAAVIIALCIALPNSGALAASLNKSVSFLSEPGIDVRYSWSAGTGRDRSFQQSAAAAVADYNSLVKAAAEQLVARSSYFEIRYNVGSSQASQIFKADSHFFSDIYSCDLPNTASDQDYLKYNLSSISLNASISGSYSILKFSPAYLTTASNEAFVEESVDRILEELNVYGSSQYEKIKAVSDYVIQNVEYDWTFSNYTAYHALYSGFAVCQGYSLLTYKLLTELGVPARIIPGLGTDSSGQSESHGWNIVQIGQYWYNLDNTWDDAGKTTKFFLKCDADFSGHTRDAEYATAAFYADHPMSPSDFDPSRDITMSPDSWAKPYVDSLSARGVIPEGLKSTYQNNITRAEFIAMIVNVYEYARGAYSLPGSSPFDDIADSMYRDQIMKGFALGLINGIDSDSFGPEQTLTREQCAKIISLAAGAITDTEIASGAVLPFVDGGDISAYAVPFVKYVFENGLMNGKDGGRFDPRGQLTRQEAMVIAERMIVKYGW